MKICIVFCIVSVCIALSLDGVSSYPRKNDYGVRASQKRKSSDDPRLESRMLNMFNNRKMVNIGRGDSRKTSYPYNPKRKAALKRKHGKHGKKSKAKKRKALYKASKGRKALNKRSRRARNARKRKLAKITARKVNKGKRRLNYRRMDVDDSEDDSKDDLVDIVSNSVGECDGDDSDGDDDEDDSGADDDDDDDEDDDEDEDEDDSGDEDESDDGDDSAGEGSNHVVQSHIDHNMSPDRYVGLLKAPSVSTRTGSSSARIVYY